MAAGATYNKIATFTTTTASTIDFTSIPATYTDLVVVVRGKAVGGTSNVKMRFNGDTASNYSNIRFLAYGSAANSEAQTNQTSAAFGDWGTIEGAAIINIFSYANGQYKNYTSRSVEPDYTSMYTGQWRSASAINQITLSYTPSSNFAVGTTATIYGIARA